MQISLGPEDLQPQYRNLPPEVICFIHFELKIQQIIRLAGRGVPYYPGRPGMASMIAPLDEDVTAHDPHESERRTMISEWLGENGHEIIQEMRGGY